MSESAPDVASSAADTAGTPRVSVEVGIEVRECPEAPSCEGLCSDNPEPVVRCADATIAGGEGNCLSNDDGSCSWATRACQ